MTRNRDRCADVDRANDFDFLVSTVADVLDGLLASTQARENIYLVNCEIVSMN
jgi:hypothetical protein